MYRQCIRNLFIPILLLAYTWSSAQAIDPARSAKADAMNDTRFIEANITANEDAMFFAQKGVDRAKDPRVKELAQELLTNHTQILYEFEQLSSAGKGSKERTASQGTSDDQLAAFNDKLAAVQSGGFDTTWVAGMLDMETARFDELTHAKETVTNARIKMAVSGALPLVKKQVSQLKSLQKNLAREALQRKKEGEREAKQKAAARN